MICSSEGHSTFAASMHNSACLSTVVATPAVALILVSVQCPCTQLQTSCFTMTVSADKQRS